MKAFLNVIGSPRFWATLIALVFICAGAFIPSIPLDEGEVTAAVVALVGFIASVSVSPTPTVWGDMLKTGKFWMLVASLAFIFIRAFVPAFPLSEDQVMAVIIALFGASVGVSYRPINSSR